MTDTETTGTEPTGTGTVPGSSGTNRAAAVPGPIGAGRSGGPGRLGARYGLAGQYGLGGRRRLPMVRGAMAIPLTAALGYIWAVDPHRPDSIFPMCPVKAVTGLDCPGCGGLRATHDLLHGNVLLALRDNAFLVIMAPLLLAVLAWERHRGRPVRLPRWAAVGVFALALAWTLVRNLPSWPYPPTITH